jgi:hypothetical protein
MASKTLQTIKEAVLNELDKKTLASYKDKHKQRFQDASNAADTHKMYKSRQGFLRAKDKLARKERAEKK